MKVYVFPGQGSQEKGMGKELFEEFPELTQKADAILGYSIKQLCVDDPDDCLNLTQYTQPALFVVNALSYLKKLKDTGIKPDFVAGHSLGEYNAVFAAGGFDFETGLKLVQKRGELMSKGNGGAMAAVIGMNEEQVRAVLNECNLKEIDIANLNAPTQIVISGKMEDIHKAKAYFEQRNARYIVLKVSAAFHSRYMKPAQVEFAEYLNRFTYSCLEIPVIANYTGLPYDGQNIKENLIHQLSSSVRWVDCIRYLLQKGEMEFQEIGPGRVLTNLINKIKMNESKKFPISEGAIQEKQHGTTEQGKAEVKVRNWNRKYPVGTFVTCRGYQEKLKTRTEAVVLFGHRAAVYMENYNGYFDLDDIQPA